MQARDLNKRKCVSCEGQLEAFDKEALSEYLQAIDNQWKLSADAKLISREFRFKDFISALAFVNQIGELAEKEAHHPDIVLKWAFVKLDIWTHATNGLTENDFILAAKIDQL